MYTQVRKCLLTTYRSDCARGNCGDLCMKHLELMHSNTLLLVLLVQYPCCKVGREKNLNAILLEFLPQLSP